MNDSALEAILRRDRQLVLVALVLLTGLTWAYVLWLSRHVTMPAAPMPGSARRPHVAWRGQKATAVCHHHIIASGMWERFHSSAA